MRYGSKYDIGIFAVAKEEFMNPNNLFCMSNGSN
jgi:hypothetical protein